MFYRPPDSNENPLIELEKQINLITCKDNVPNFTIAGDFNFPSINWQNNTVERNPQYGIKANERFVKMIDENFLHQIVDKETHGNNILDLFLTTSPDLFTSCETIPGMSKHSAVVVEYQTKVSIKNVKAREVYAFKKANAAEIVQNLIIMKDEFLHNCNNRDVNENWSFFKDRIINIVEENVPKQKVKKKTDLPWVTQRIKKILNKRKRAYKKARETSQEKDWESYRILQKNLRKEIKLAHDAYLENIFDNADNNSRNKRLWSYVKSLKREKVGIAALQEKDMIFTEGEDKAKALSNQFRKVFTVEDLTNIPHVEGEKLPKMEEIKIDLNGIIKLLHELNINKAVGPDKLPTIILKEYADIIAPVLYEIFQQSIETGVPPKDWLTANVTAIFKNKDDKLNPSNYRPISLTCVLCKLFEHIIFTNILSHYKTYNIINENQHGFQKGRSCETQLINTFNEISKEIDDHKTVHCMILDFSKAFDTVPFKRLIQKLDFYGVSGNLLKWIENWLTKRTQTVVIEDCHSDEEEVLSGVPQGTVLGPLLFLTYINSICDGITCRIKLFADDCLLYKTINDENDTKILQNDLDKIVKWCNLWQMSFNIDKCKMLKISKKLDNINVNYKIKGEEIENVKQHTYLGIELTNTLSWKEHINKILSKANKTLNMLRRNFYKSPSDIKKQAYTTLVRPILEYASSCWDPYEEVLINNLEAVQSKAARFIKNDYKWESSVTKMKNELGLHLLQQRRFIARHVQFHKAMILDTGVKLQNESNTSDVIQHMHARTDTYKYSFLPRTSRCWNIIPKEIRTTTSTEKFQKDLTNAFESGYLVMTSPRGIYNRPALGRRVKENGNAVY